MNIIRICFLKNDGQLSNQSIFSLVDLIESAKSGHLFERDSK